MSFLMTIAGMFVSKIVAYLLDALFSFVGKKTAEMEKKAAEKKIAEKNLADYNSALEKGDLNEIAKAAERLLNRAND